MIYLPSSPAAGGPMLAAYIAADPHRTAIYEEILARLETAGGLGPRARFWICQRPERRAVLRGVLIALKEKLPPWSKDCRASAEENGAFLQTYQATYRAEQRASASQDDDANWRPSLGTPSTSDVPC